MDMWTSRNGISLAGVVVHFIDNTGKLWNFLLGLPSHHTAHSGINIADTVSAIIHHFSIPHDKVSYFYSDNASNNDTCIDALGLEFGFDPVKWRLRCVGHIINLIAKAVMVGYCDNDVLEVELDAEGVKEREQLIAWRKRGPVGKLHNIIIYILGSTQRTELFESLQQLVSENGGNAVKETIYRLIRDNDTRWNSLYTMIERALLLRDAIEEFMQLEVNEWTVYEVMQTHAEYCTFANSHCSAEQLQPSTWSQASTPPSKDEEAPFAT